METTILTAPFRGAGADRPRGIPLPPGRMPLLRAGRLLKTWRYVSIWSRELSLCAARVQVGPARQEFWAVWDRATGRLWQRTRLWPRCVRLPRNHVQVCDGDVRIDITLEENDGFEVITPDGRAYTWTRKQGGIRAHGLVRLGGAERRVEALALVDDNAGYHPRHTRWQWSGGAGQDIAGRTVAWSAIVGLNDAPRNSERTLWIDGAPREFGPVRFADDLSLITFAEGDQLRFHEEAVRRRRDNLLLIRSRYRQPFGRFSGSLPGGITLGEAYGVMEWHEAHW